MPRAQKIFYIVIAVSIAWLYLSGLGSYPLTERSEARYAGVAWEMLRSGDFLTPRYNGIKHFHKPPLFYWSSAASMAVFGTNEAAARLPCALSALATLALVAWWAGRKDTGGNRAWLAPACLATSPLFWEMGRVAVTDMLLTFLVTACLACAWSLMSDGPSSVPLHLFWLLLGLGFLDKGPLVLLIVGMTLIPCFVSGRARWQDFGSWSGIALACLVALPWYIWATLSNPGLLDYFLRFQTVDRVLTTVHNRVGPPWYYLPIILGGLLPWSVWLPSSLAGAVKKVRKSPKAESSIDLFLLSWIVLPTLFFSCIGSKLPPYVLPIFPALALLLARQIQDSTRSNSWAPLTVFGLAAAACAGQIAWRWSPRLTVFSKELGWAAVWLSLIIIGSLILTLRREPLDLTVMPFVAMVGLLAIALSGMGKLERLSARPLADAILRNTSGQYEVAMHGGYLFGLPYYLNSFITHVDYPREVQFETDPRTHQRMVSSLSECIAKMKSSPNDSFLVLPSPMLERVRRRSDTTVIYRDEKWGVLKHQGDSR